MLTPRDYQQRTIDLTYEYLSTHDGNPCIVLPTGAGKSLIIAIICKDALQKWPETRVLMLTGSKELISQNADKLRAQWPGAPLGIYSAGIGRRELGEPITFAGIQSVRKRAKQIGHIDIIIIDECHLVSHKDEGRYRYLIAELLEINPHLRVIGLTATPWRLGHGLITDEPAIFSDLIEPTSIEELISKGHLAPLRSKHTELALNVDGVHKRGGEYIESELQKAVDTEPQNKGAVAEIIRRSEDRNHWLLFCTGVDHANHIRDLLIESGISAETLNGETPSAERQKIIENFKSGKFKALTNVNVLTTGFDFPNIDLLAFLRPTLSPVLYVQQGGRGMRPAPGKVDCLVFDFAGIVGKLGPITAVQPPKKKGEKKGEMPTKVCEECQEIVPLSTLICPSCGAAFPEPEVKEGSLHNDDIMGIEGSTMTLSEWRWRVHTSSSSGKSMLRVDYYGEALSDPVVSEYLTVAHSGSAGQRAMRTLTVIARSADIVIGKTLAETAENLQAGEPPKEIEFKKDRKFFRVLRRSWPVKQLELQG